MGWRLPHGATQLTLHLLGVLGENILKACTTPAKDYVVSTATKADTHLLPSKDIRLKSVESFRMHEYWKKRFITTGTTNVCS